MAENTGEKDDDVRIAAADSRAGGGWVERATISRRNLPKAVFIELNSVTDDTGALRNGAQDAISAIEKHLPVYLVIDGASEAQKQNSAALASLFTSVLESQGPESQKALAKSIKVAPDAVLHLSDYLNNEGVEPDFSAAADALIKDRFQALFSWSWSPNTSAYDNTYYTNPAWGQSEATALVTQDLLGGEIVHVFARTLAHDEESRFPKDEDKWQSYRTEMDHYLNVLPDGSVVDFSRCQFPKNTLFVSPASMNNSTLDSPGALVWFNGDEKTFTPKESARLVDNTRTYLLAKEHKGSLRDYLLPPQEKNPPEFATDAEEHEYEAKAYRGSGTFRWDKYTTLASNVKNVEKGKLFALA